MIFGVFRSVNLGAFTSAKQISRNFGGPNPGLTSIPFRRQEKSGYYIDPEEATKRVMKVIAAHPEVKNLDKLTLGSTWFELGICDLTKTEILLEVENEFDVQFADEDVERSRDVRDVVEYVSRSFFAQ